MDSPDLFAPSTIKGNRVLKTYIGAKNVSVEKLFWTEAHQMLRNGVTGRLGHIFDKASFSQNGRDLAKALDANILRYTEQAVELRGIFEKNYGKTGIRRGGCPAQKSYASLERLQEHVTAALKENPDDADASKYSETSEKAKKLMPRPKLFSRNWMASFHP
jgi:hypothetical protein